MNTLSYRTQSANSDSIKRDWYLVDAEHMTLGRMSSEIAKILRGKHKAYFTPHVDCGDYVIVINAEKVKLTGNKVTDKKYVSYTGYPGGQRVKTPQQLLASKPHSVVERSVRGMLPKNRLGRAMFKKLFVYAGPDHPHNAQKPKSLKF